MRSIPIRKRYYVTALSSILAMGVVLAGAGASAKAPEFASSCVSCHGDNGHSSEGELPIIAGVSSFFIENQILQFQEKTRPCAADRFKAKDGVKAADHCAVVAGMPEATVKKIAEYYSAQPHKKADQVVDEKLALQGKKVHEQRCDKCHSEGGGLAMDDAGILAGQWKPYLVSSMTEFKTGDRWQDEKMKKEMKKLSDDDIKALAEYYASQSKAGKVK